MDFFQQESRLPESVTLLDLFLLKYIRVIKKIKIQYTVYVGSFPHFPFVIKIILFNNFISVVFKMNINMFKKNQIYLRNHMGSFQIKLLISQTQAYLEIVCSNWITFNYMFKEYLHSKIPQTIKMMLISMDTDNPMAIMMKLDIL